MDIRPLSEILADYGLTTEQYKRLEALPFYQNALENYRLEWNSAKSVHERLKLKSAVMLEEAFPVLGARMRSSEEPLPAAVETAKLLAKITGRGEAKTQQVNPAEKFVITINLGADRDAKEIKFEKDVTPLIEGTSNE